LFVCLFVKATFIAQSHFFGKYWALEKIFLENRST